MRARCISLAELTPRDESLWRELALRAVEPNPFLEPDSVLAAWHNLPEAAGLHLMIA
mgnify:CR=1 FL=1